MSTCARRRSVRSWLIPGRYFEVESLDGEIDGTYFITKVHHVVSTEEGYITQLEFKGAKA